MKVDLRDPDVETQKLIRIAAHLGYCRLFAQSLSQPMADGRNCTFGSEWEVIFYKPLDKRILEKGLKEAIRDLSEVQKVLNGPQAETEKLIKDVYQ